MAFEDRSDESAVDINTFSLHEKWGLCRVDKVIILYMYVVRG
jgi:hypothetical protein